MPNLARALERGRHGGLESCLPPYSSPAWVSIATGKSPGTHGIFDFWEAGAPGEKRLVSSRSARGAKLWDLVDAAGKVANVVAVPVSFPPARLEHGRFVCGMFTPGEDVDYTWPQELKAELKAMPGGYEADPFALGLEGLEFIEQTQFWIRQQEIAVGRLLDKGDWDLLFTVIQAPDPLQHKFWNVLDPTDPRFDAERAADRARAVGGVLPALRPGDRRPAGDGGARRDRAGGLRPRLRPVREAVLHQPRARGVRPADAVRRDARHLTQRPVDADRDRRHPPARRAGPGEARADQRARAAGPRHRQRAGAADRRRADDRLRGRGVRGERVHRRLGARGGAARGRPVRDRRARGRPRSPDRRADHRARVPARGRLQRQRAAPHPGRADRLRRAAVHRVRPAGGRRHRRADPRRRRRRSPPAHRDHPGSRPGHRGRRAGRRADRRRRTHGAACHGPGGARRHGRPGADRALLRRPRGAHARPGATATPRRRSSTPSEEEAAIEQSLKNLGYI